MSEVFLNKPKLNYFFIGWKFCSMKLSNIKFFSITNSTKFAFHINIKISNQSLNSNFCKYYVVQF